MKLYIPFESKSVVSRAVKHPSPNKESQERKKKLENIKEKIDQKEISKKEKRKLFNFFSKR